MTLISIMATPVRSSHNELVIEAGRMSIQAGGREVCIKYGDKPGLDSKNIYLELPQVKTDQSQHIVHCITGDSHESLQRLSIRIRRMAISER